MSFKIKFRTDALKEWNNLDRSIQHQFSKKLKKCSEAPYIPSARLKGSPDYYKIKLKSSGFRLVYQIFNDALIIAAVAVGKCEHSEVYNLTSKRLR